MIANIINFALFILEQLKAITKFEVQSCALAFVKLAALRAVEFRNIRIFVIRFDIDSSEDVRHRSIATRDCS